jgi:hypothetical protein
MGGSKPSQFWQKDPPATDRKWRAEDEGVLEREKHELANEAQDREMIPEAKPAARSRAPSGSQEKKRAGKRKKSGR